MDQSSALMRADQMTDESLESTRRILRLTAETQEVGVSTMINLDEQGEQLNRIEDGLDDMDAGLTQAEKTMNRMERCCGLCLCPGSGNKFSSRNKGTYRRIDEGEREPLITQQPRSHAAGGRRDLSGQPGNQADGGRFVQRVMNDSREDEMEENLGQVSNMLGNLQNLALDMGDTLDQQNRQLDRINDKAEHNEGHLESVNKQSKRILRKA